MKDDITFDWVFSYEHLLHCAYECFCGVRWKPSTQCFEVEVLERVSELKMELDAGTYKSKGFHSFDIWERGKKRHIQSVHISERIVQKCLCEFCLKPVLEACLINTNSASQKGKGTDYALKHLKEDLRWHFAKYGTEGGILIGDFHDFFGSIPHGGLRIMLKKKIQDKRLFKIAVYFIECFDGDKGLGLGSEISQICAIYYPNYIDHVVRERYGVRYGRYNDDFYAISESMELLIEVKAFIFEESDNLGLTLNPKKTVIVRLDQSFTWLKKRIHYTPSGKIIMRLVPKNIKDRRACIRKAVSDGRPKECREQSRKSWEGYALKYHGYKSVKSVRNYERSKEELCSMPQKKTSNP